MVMKNTLFHLWRDQFEKQGRWIEHEVESGDQSAKAFVEGGSYNVPTCDIADRETRGAIEA